jgi:hypothetical protein
MIAAVTYWPEADIAIFIQFPLIPAELNDEP